MTRFIASLRYFYILTLLCSFLYSSVSAKNDSNFEYTSVPESTTIPRLILLTGDEITFTNDGILVVLGESETISYKNNGKVELVATKKIVFKPGTRILPGEVLKASITNSNIKEERSLRMITYELSKLFNKREAKNVFNKDRDKNNTVLSSSKVYGVIVDNQQRRTGNIKIVTNNFSANYVTSKYNVCQTISGFKPETVEVLRL